MGDMSRHLCVVIAEDSVLLRSGLARLLADEDVCVVGAVGDGGALLEAVATHRPDVAIVDVRMPPTFTDEGIRAALSIKESFPEVSVLVLSHWVEETAASDLLRRGAGGTGYLLKDRVTNVDDFMDAIRRVASGGSALDPDVVTQILARRQEQDMLDRLTAREVDVLSAMAEGLNNAAVAKRLYLSERAIEKHVRGIFTKLGLSADNQDQHRRVTAVVQFLSTTTRFAERWQDSSRRSESAPNGRVVMGQRREFGEET